MGDADEVFDGDDSDYDIEEPKEEEEYVAPSQAHSNAVYIDVPDSERLTGDRLTLMELSEAINHRIAQIDHGATALCDVVGMDSTVKIALKELISRIDNGSCNPYILKRDYEVDDGVYNREYYKVRYMKLPRGIANKAWTDPSLSNTLARLGYKAPVNADTKPDVADAANAESDDAKPVKVPKAAEAAKPAKDKAAKSAKDKSAKPAKASKASKATK